MCYEVAHGMSAECWDTSLCGEVHEVFEERRCQPIGCKEVIDAWHKATKDLEIRHVCNHPCAEGDVRSVVLLLQNLATNTRHVHVARAFATTALAGETRREDLFDCVVQRWFRVDE